MKKQTPLQGSKEADYLDRQLLQEAKTLALAKLKEKGIEQEDEYDPYDDYYSWLNTYQVQFYNELRLKHGLANLPKERKKKPAKTMYKPAHARYPEDWQEKIYGR